MLLKRQEKENIIKAIYDSSNILASVYDKNTNDLTLIFNKGGQYKYAGVSNTDYTRFEISESQGKVFNSHLKNYKFEKLDNVNPELIIKEVNELKELERKNILDGKQSKIVNEMKTLIAKETSRYSETELERLIEVIKNYIKELNS